MAFQVITVDLEFICIGKDEIPKERGHAVYLLTC